MDEAGGPLRLHEATIILLSESHASATDAALTATHEVMAFERATELKTGGDSRMLARLAGEAHVGWPSSGTTCREFTPCRSAEAAL